MLSNRLYSIPEKYCQGSLRLNSIKMSSVYIKRTTSHASFSFATFFVKRKRIFPLSFPCSMENKIISNIYLNVTQ